jgi:hypothetical protein
MTDSRTLQDIVNRSDEVMTHAWMVRTFVKHSEETEDFPDLLGLMGCVRGVFDMTRALETRVGDPAAYLHMLRKKIGRLKKAAAEFERDAAQVSIHTNWVMAARSLNLCVRDLEALLAEGNELKK